MSTSLVKTDASALATLYNHVMSHPDEMPTISELYEILCPEGNPLTDITLWEKAKLNECKDASILGAKVQAMIKNTVGEDSGSWKRAGKNFVVCILVLHHRLDLRSWIPVFKNILSRRSALDEDDEKRASLLDDLDELPFSTSAKWNLVGMFKNIPRAANNIAYVLRLCASVGVSDTYADAHSSGIEEPPMVDAPRITTNRRRDRDEKTYTEGVSAFPKESMDQDSVIPITKKRKLNQDQPHHPSASPPLISQSSPSDSGH
jgi:hypothetical protein